MWNLELVRQVSRDDLGPLGDLFAAAERETGRPALSDHLRLDLLSGGGPGFTGLVLWGPDRLRPVAYGQLSRSASSWLLQVVVDPERSDDEVAASEELLSNALTEIRTQGGGTVQWWVHEPTEEHDRLAATVGFTPHRDLLQMRCSLPLDLPPAEPLSVRAFRPGEDDQAWLELNNLAFAGHPEQGGWTLTTLEQRMEEDWFDPEGFLLHEGTGPDAGLLLGFCWTKVHHHAEPPMGEIYVIGVHPAAHGRGLGRALSRAGYDHLAAAGLTVGMLYVDAANSAALALYRRLGMSVASTDRAYTADLP